MRQFLVSISTLSVIAVLGAAPALAQTSGSDAASTTTATSQPMAGSHDAGTNASDVTCAEVTKLDTMMVPAVLYFIAGHEAGKQGSMGAGDASQAPDPASGDAGSSASATAGGTSDAMDQSSSDAGSDATSSSDAGSGTDATSGTDTAATDSASASGDATAPAGSSTADSSGSDSAASTDAAAATPDTADAGSDGAVDVVAIGGFYSIPVEETIIACEEEPDRRAADVVKEQQQRKEAGQ